MIGKEFLEWCKDKVFIWPHKDTGKERYERKKINIVVQMPCGCPVGTHPPGPCGITGMGQEVK